MIVNPSRMIPWNELGLAMSILLLAPRLARTDSFERPEQPIRSAQIEIVKREIESLNVQVQRKDAHVQEAKLLFDAIRKRNERDVRGNRFGPAPEEDPVMRLAVTTHRLELGVKEAELQEPLVRLKHAQRRLDSLQRSTADEREQAPRTWPRFQRRFAQPGRARIQNPEDDGRESKEQIERLQDEIELLRVQAKIKEVRMQAEKELADEHEARRERMLQLNKTTPGSIPSEEVHANFWRMKSHRAQQHIYEAELQEPLVRIKQIERRLARLQRAAPGSGTPQEQRLQALEKKVAQILEEIKSLKSQRPQPPKGRSPDPARK